MDEGLEKALRERFGGLGTTFWALWVGLLLNRSGQFVQPLLSWWLTGVHGFTLAGAGLAAGAYGLGGVCGTLLGGVLADRHGRRVALLLSAFGATALLVTLAAADGPAAIFAGVFLLAVAYEMHRPAVQAMIADVVAPPERVRAYALIYVSVNLGFAIAPALAGWIAGRSYPAVFLAAAVVQLAWAAFVVVKLPESRPTAARPRPGTGAGLAEVLRDRLFLAWIGLLALAALVPHQAFVALAGWMKAEGFDGATYGSVVGLNGLLIVVVQPWLTPRLSRVPPLDLFAASALLQGVGFALHGLGVGLGGHVLAVAVWTFGEILGSPVFGSVAAAMAPVHLRARYQALGSGAFATAGTIGPAVGGFAVDRWGGAIWPACLVVGILAATLSLPLRPHLRARLLGTGLAT